MGDATGLNAEDIALAIKSAKAQLVAIDLKGIQNLEAIAKKAGVGKVHLVEK